jgi:hypothetical protein
MNAREAGIVGIGLVGVVLVLIGFSMGVLGVTWFYAIEQYEKELKEQDWDINVPPATPLMIWTLSSAAVLLLMGVALVRLRVTIVERWIVVPSASTAERPDLSIDSGATAAVGVVGVCLLVVGLSSVAGAAANGWAYGWDDESTRTIWQTLPYVLGGVVLMFRPRLISWMWKGKTKDAG